MLDKPNVHLFNIPLILNLNKLFEETDMYKLAVDNYDSVSGDSTVLSIYKEENNILLEDLYNTYQININHNKINILAVELDISPEVKVKEEIRIKKYEVIEFDQFPEESPAVLMKPILIYQDRYVCEYCEGYGEAHNIDICECEEPQIDIGLSVQRKGNIFNPKPIPAVVLSTKNIIFCFDKITHYVYVITEQGIHTDNSKALILAELARMSNKKRITSNMLVRDEFYISQDIKLAVNYNYNPNWKIKPLVIQLYFENTVINIHIGNYKYFRSIIDNNLLQDLKNFAKFVIENVPNSEIGIYSSCNLDLKDVVDIVPEELIYLVKEGFRDNCVELNKVIDSVSEVIIKLCYENSSKTEVEIDDTIVSISQKVKIKIVEYYVVKLIGEKAKKLLAFLLDETERPPNINTSASVILNFFYYYLESKTGADFWHK